MAEPVDPNKVAAGGYKADEDKPRFDLLPPDALIEVAKVYALGAKKYDDRNWERGMAWGRVYGAAQRHLAAFWAGERFDPVDGQHHLAAAAFNVLALLAYDLRGIGHDNRQNITNTLRMPSYAKNEIPPLTLLDENGRHFAVPGTWVMGTPQGVRGAFILDPRGNSKSGASEYCPPADPGSSHNDPNAVVIRDRDTYPR